MGVEVSLTNCLPQQKPKARLRCLLGRVHHECPCVVDVQLRGVHGLYDLLVPLNHETAKKLSGDRDWVP